MKRFTWWRMEQNAPHNARERWCASCSILHHVKRFMSHSPKIKDLPDLPDFPDLPKSSILVYKVTHTAKRYESFKPVDIF